MDEFEPILNTDEPGAAEEPTAAEQTGAAEEPREVAVNLRGAATVTTLAGSKNDVNAIDDEKVRPVVENRAFGGSLTVPACSVTVLRVAAR